MSQNNSGKPTQNVTSEKHSEALLWTLTIALISLIIVLLLGCYFVIINATDLFSTIETDSMVYFTDNHINGLVDLKNESIFPWWALIGYVIIICAISFIISKVISVLRDLIENEQVNNRYAQTKNE